MADPKVTSVKGLGYKAIFTNKRDVIKVGKKINYEVILPPKLCEE